MNSKRLELVTGEEVTTVIDGRFPVLRCSTNKGNVWYFVEVVMGGAHVRIGPFDEIRPMDGLDGHFEGASRPQEERVIRTQFKIESRPGRVGGSIQILGASDRSE